ncbi:MAG: AMP-binding protein [Magnetococcales bacterium]|nr:AMP-binding protein [Magnetococcales bacterium]MBF0114295.1 AMP-binding protein [Magnetococcales bacterium]
MDHYPWLSPPDHTAQALRMDHHLWHYGQLMTHAELLSRAIDWSIAGPLRLLAILGNQDPWVYPAMLAAHRLGGGFLPLHPAFPSERLQHMLHQCQTRLLLVTSDGLATLDQLLPNLSDSMLCIITEDTKGNRPLLFPQHRFLDSTDLQQLPARPAHPAPNTQAAYVMFTSGSTGRAKGVAVSFANLHAYVRYWQTHHPIGPGDRVAQPADITFDLSIHPIFVSWASGALLCPIPPATRFAPARFILEQQLTVWVSVPSVAMMMERLNILRPALFPTIRLSLFCGEPLPTRTAEAWRQSTPQGRLLNLYGPTEATVAISAFEWQAESAQQEPPGNVPIGWTFPEQQAALLQEDGSLLLSAGTGDLCLAGSQVTGGYLADPDKSAAHYFYHPDSGATLWYRTGDWVQRREDGCLLFLNRVDQQIKRHGYRIELHEIEHVLRARVGHDWVAVIPWPGGTQPVRALVACVAAEENSPTADWLQHCRQHLPSYMVPSRIMVVPQLPLNHNGKINRAALQQLVQATLFPTEAT